MRNVTRNRLKSSGVVPALTWYAIAAMEVGLTGGEMVPPRVKVPI